MDVFSVPGSPALFGAELFRSALGVSFEGFTAFGTEPFCDIVVEILHIRFLKPVLKHIVFRIFYVIIHGFVPFRSMSF